MQCSSKVPVTRDQNTKKSKQGTRKLHTYIHTCVCMYVYTCTLRQQGIKSTKQARKIQGVSQSSNVESKQESGIIGTGVLVNIYEYMFTYILFIEQKRQV